MGTLKEIAICGRVKEYKIVATRTNMMQMHARKSFIMTYLKLTTLDFLDCERSVSI